MTCDGAKERLSPYLDDVLPPRERTELESHLQSCAACRAEKEALARTISLVAGLPRLTPPVGLAGRVLASVGPPAPSLQRRALPWFRVFGAAAAVLLTMAVGYRIFLGNEEELKSPPMDSRVAADTVGTPADREGEAIPNQDGRPDSMKRPVEKNPQVTADELARIEESAKKLDLDTPRPSGRANRTPERVMDEKPSRAVTDAVRKEKKAGSDAGPAPDPGTSSRRAHGKPASPTTAIPGSDHVFTLSSVEVRLDANTVHELLEQAVNPHAVGPVEGKGDLGREPETENREASEKFARPSPRQTTIEVKLTSAEYRRFLASLRRVQRFRGRLKERVSSRARAIQQKLPLADHDKDASESKSAGGRAGLRPPHAPESPAPRATPGPGAPRPAHPSPSVPPPGEAREPRDPKAGLAAIRRHADMVTLLIVIRRK